MSYLITSNIPDENVLRANSGLNLPYSYTNNLNDTFKIPKNSQIAVESVKLVKNGNFSLTRNNSTFAFYFGQDVDTSITDDWINLLSYAVQSSPFEFSSNTSFEGSVDFIATKLEEVANKIIFHPNLLENASTGVGSQGFKVVVERNASNLDFVGFKFTIESPTTSENEDLSGSLTTADFDVALFSEPGTFAWTPGSKTFANNGTAGFTGTNTFVLQKAPISLVDGKIVYQLTKQDGVSQRYGLCRGLGDNLLGTGFKPQYLFESIENTRGDGFLEIFDYEVEISDNASGTIKVFYMNADPALGATVVGGNILMNRAEFDYRYLNGGNYFNAKDDDITKITFTVKNERVKIQLTNGSLVETVLTDGSSVNSASNVKPVNMATRFLFPKMQIEGGESVQILNYESVQIKNFEYGYQQLVELTKEFYLRMSLDSSGPALLAQMETEGTKATDFSSLLGLTVANRIDYSAKLIFAPTQLYPFITNNCNSARALGFFGRAIAQPTQSFLVGDELVWISDTPPTLRNTESLFVRMKNLTINSTNLANGRHSKILYHIPSFSNTDNSVGTLFFAPNEKMYIDLNNTEDLFMNSIEVDICRSDETLATSLGGKTTVCFHVRQKS